MTNIDIKYYIVFLNGNTVLKNPNIDSELVYNDSVNCAFIDESHNWKYINIPTLAVEVPGKDYLIEYFTHKRIVEKKDLAHPELSYVKKREATLADLKNAAKISKTVREQTVKGIDPLKYYKDHIQKCEKFSLREYETYIASLEELSSIFNSSDLKLRREPQE